MSRQQEEITPRVASPSGEVTTINHNNNSVIDDPVNQATEEGAVTNDQAVTAPTSATLECEGFGDPDIQAITGVLILAYKAEQSPHEATENTLAPELPRKKK